MPGKLLQAQPGPILAALAPSSGTQDQNQEGRAPTSLGSKAVLGSDLGAHVQHPPPGVQGLLQAPVFSMAMITQDSSAKAGFLLGPTAPGAC